MKAILMAATLSIASFMMQTQALAQDESNSKDQSPSMIILVVPEGDPDTQLKFLKDKREDK